MGLAIKETIEKPYNDIGNYYIMLYFSNLSLFLILICIYYYNLIRTIYVSTKEDIVSIT